MKLWVNSPEEIAIAFNLLNVNKLIKDLKSLHSPCKESKKLLESLETAKNELF